MPAIQMMITDAGLDALVDAQNAGSETIEIASMALSDTPFVMAPTLEALPGQFKVLEGVSGEVVAENIIHLTAYDVSDDSYDMTGFGLFLTDDTLFAVYSAASEPVLAKAELAFALFSHDIAFLDNAAANISFGNAVFSYPPATETIKGVAKIATTALASAGTDDETIISPLKLKQMLDLYVAVTQKGVADGVASLDATGKVPTGQLPPLESRDTFVVASEAAMLALAASAGDFAVRTDEAKNYVLSAEPATTLGNWVELLTPGAPVSSVNGKVGVVAINSADVGAVPLTRAIGGTGLVTGGGALDANRTVDVAAASNAEALAAAITNKAVVPGNLAQIFAAIGQSVPNTRSVTGSGIATGGGALNVNQVINVPGSSPEEMLAATAGDRAVTPSSLASLPRLLANNGYYQFPGILGDRFIMQWGRATSIPNNFTTVTLPMAFPTQFFGVLASGTSESYNDAQDNWPQPFGYPTNLYNFRVYTPRDSSDVFFFLALGK